MEESTDEAGFTLIELMVVLLIMGILMAIAIPTFLGAANGAHNTAAQSDLTNAMTSAKSVYATNGSYTTTTKAVTALQKAEPEMKFAATTTSASGSTHIGVNVPTTPAGGNILVLASYATATKSCWLAVDNETSGTATVNTKTAPDGISYALLTNVAVTACLATATPTAYTGATATTGKYWMRHYPKT